MDGVLVRAHGGRRSTVSGRRCRTDEITSAWTRSRLSGVHETVRPQPGAPLDVDRSRLLVAARPVLERAAQDLAGTQLGLVLADGDARILQSCFEDVGLREELGALGIVPGTSLAEDVVGANGIGTPLEIRQGLMMYGADHYMTVFREFTCFGQPIVNPITKRVEGVLNIGGSSTQHGLFGVVAKQLVSDIEQRLEETAADSHRRMLAAFHAASGRGSKRPVVLVGEDLVLATPAALDLLDTPDHAVIRAVAQDATTGPRRPRRELSHTVTLESGRRMALRCTPVDDADGVIVELTPGEESPPSTPGVRLDRLPLLIVGETGSGRTTRARERIGDAAQVVDAADVAWHGERDWLSATREILESDGPGLIVENIHLLSAPAAATIAKSLAESARDVVVTATAGEQLATILTPIIAQCAAREDLVPLRNRPHDVPYLAQRMLAEQASTTTSRLTTETLRVLSVQQWPGNLTELRRVIEGLLRARSVGDIVPADLPATHRQASLPSSPVQQAERDVITMAIAAAGGNKVQAARALGVSRSTLYNKMRALRMA